MICSFPEQRPAHGSDNRVSAPRAHRQRRHEHVWNRQRAPDAATSVGGSSRTISSSARARPGRSLPRSWSRDTAVLASRLSMRDQLEDGVARAFERDFEWHLSPGPAVPGRPLPRGEQFKPEWARRRAQLSRDSIAIRSVDQRGSLREDRDLQATPAGLVLPGLGSGFNKKSASSP
jgi:hypothetical protein